MTNRQTSSPKHVRYIWKAAAHTSSRRCSGTSNKGAHSIDIFDSAILLISTKCIYWFHLIARRYFDSVFIPRRIQCDCRINVHINQSKPIQSRIYMIIRLSLNERECVHYNCTVQIHAHTLRLTHSLIHTQKKTYAGTKKITIRLKKKIKF